jgi:FAD/FMN-containing dehydrogenase
MADARRSPFTSYAGTKPAIVPDAAVLARFAALVGEKYALTAPDDRAPYEREWRDHYVGRAALVLRPGSVEDVAAIARLASETGTALIPQGGNTGLVGGQTPHETGHEIVVSLTRLDRIRDIDPVGNTMVAESGVILQKAQEAAADMDRLLAMSIGSQGSCTIGGNISTNAGGINVLAYGNMRELVLGLEVVLPDGRIWNGLRRLKKDNTGYDLRHLFMGAEGTLGFITAAVLKLHPRPRSQIACFAAVPDPDAALALMGRLQGQATGTLTSYELLPRIAIDIVLACDSGARDPVASRSDWYVLFEVSSSAREGVAEDVETVLGDAMEAGLVTDATIAASEAQRAAFWRMREMVSEAQKPLGGSIKHDISVPVAAVPAFLSEAATAVEQIVPGARPVAFGHMGDGNIHFNVSQPAEGMDKAAFMARYGEVNDMVHGIVMKHKGSISAEHGIGRLKRHLLPEVKDPVELDLMRKLKATIDPLGIMNPGKVL